MLIAGHVEIRFVIPGGPQDSLAENPTCYARTTQMQRHFRRQPPRIGKSGKLLGGRLTHYARYQDYVDYVRRCINGPQLGTLHSRVWPDLAAGARYQLDVIVQFAGRRHADPDHVASTIADALFPCRPRSKPMAGREGFPLSYRPAWNRTIIEKAPGDSLVVARTIDFRDGAKTAFVAVRIHGPYSRADWYDERAAAEVMGSGAASAPTG
jgi:hypothetical protein